MNLGGTDAHMFHVAQPCPNREGPFWGRRKAKDGGPTPIIRIGRKLSKTDLMVFVGEPREASSTFSCLVSSPPYLRTYSWYILHPPFSKNSPYLCPLLLVVPPFGLYFLFSKGQSHPLQPVLFYQVIKTTSLPPSVNPNLKRIIIVLHTVSGYKFIKFISQPNMFITH